MKEAILTAAIEVIARDGLNNWTVEEVANSAHCAKGLVNYHYRSKPDLLRRAAETLRDDRSARRLAAVQAPGTAALDRLWTCLREEVGSGWFAAWVSLLAADDPLRLAAAERPADVSAFVAAMGRSLQLDGMLAPKTGLIQSALNGIQLQLLQGASVPASEEAYHALWLAVLP